MKSILHVEGLPRGSGALSFTLGGPNMGRVCQEVNIGDSGWSENRMYTAVVSACRILGREGANWLWKVQVSGGRESSRAYIGKEGKNIRRLVYKDLNSFVCAPLSLTYWPTQFAHAQHRDRELSRVTFTVATCGTATNARIQSHRDSLSPERAERPERP